MRSCLFALSLSIVLSGASFAETTLVVPIPLIDQYYKDVSYVALHSTPQEQTIMLAHMAGRGRDNSFLKDKRLMPVYEKLTSIMSARLDIDKGIFKGPFGDESADCRLTAEPRQLLRRQADQVALMVRRESVRPLDLTRPAASLIPDFLHPRRAPGLTFDQIDLWLLVHEQWRLLSTHLYPI